ncbi:ribonuclease HII [Streptomyces sp. ST2-7A]|uniref:ribonuclease HII n=1 Tax=Streptomyces sp. ST2-7A TaxID=2907214 RepID=UPI001F213A5E|nr:ribonuclease HII [Streptomyces sp. ST2-7A]MCE7081242.1 ribonuclease HII [Streptomyces sp. ST2-7A]
MSTSPITRSAGSAPTGSRSATRRQPTARPVPDHGVERSLRARTGARLVAGVDEVGRGAWAGPVTVCAAVTGLRRPPDGLTDSKLLSPARRVGMAAQLEEWVTSHALGHASPEEIDTLGMTAALRLAAIRALEALPERPDAVILDGSHDYLGPPWTVRTVVKGDLSCVPVAAASVLAKVDRDGRLAELGRDHPDFAFERNSGYPSPTHRAALERLGPTPHHRLSWSYLDALPRWRHLRKPAPATVRSRPHGAAADAPAPGQLGMF